jgi:bifunctional polynucleotide phosphatase/kinase
MDGTLVKTKSGGRPIACVAARLSTVTNAHAHAFPSSSLSPRASSCVLIIRPGNTFPINERDWVFFNDHVPSTLRRLHAQGYTLVIFSNQAGFSKRNLFTGRGKQVMNKIDAFTEQLCLPLTAHLATAHDGNRKPDIGMLLLFKASMRCDALHADSFFCGDAAGRDGDHSADDRGFAREAGLQFMLPEDVFVPV